MSEQALKEFLAKVAEDAELARKVQEAGTDVDQMIRLGEENGCEFTAEDLKAVHDAMGKLIGEGLQKFMEKASTDKELTRKMEEAGTDLDAIVRLGKENGCEFTEGNLMALQNSMIENDTELSDEELEKVAGGIVTLLLAGIAAGMAALGAAAGAGIAVVATHVAHQVAGKGGK